MNHHSSNIGLFSLGIMMVLGINLVLTESLFACSTQLPPSRRSRPSKEKVEDTNQTSNILKSSQALSFHLQ